MSNQISQSTTQRFLLGGVFVVGGSLLMANWTEAAEVAYAWANNPTATHYTAPGNYSYNAGQAVKITRQDIGKYQVKFGRVAKAGGTVQISAYGKPIGYCTIKNWSGGTVNVGCFNGRNQPADRQFSILAVKGKGAEKHKLSYAWLQSGNKVSYTASPNYRLGSGSMKVSRSATGRYNIDLGSSVRNEATLLASGYGGRSHCGIVNWGSGKANVICNNTDALAVDSPATVLAITKGWPGASFVWNSSPAGKVNSNYSHSSDGRSQSVTKLSVGRYRVVLGPEANSGGNIQVSAYGSGVTCWPERWDGGQVTVRCAKGKKLSDSTFVVLGLKKKVRVQQTNLREDCIPFNPSRVEVVQRNGRWKIVEGSHWIFDFAGDRHEATRSLAIIKNYKMDQVCYVGRPNPSMTYLLVNGSAPSGGVAGEDCIRFNPARVEVVQRNGRWKIAEGSHWIFDFAGNRHEANRSLAIIKKYKMGQGCYVGRPDPSFTYLRS